MLSCGAIACLQKGQCEVPISDRFRGRRYTTTFRKLPRQAPKAKNHSAVSTLNVLCKMTAESGRAPLNHGCARNTMAPMPINDSERRK